ncbi:MAG: hypothetical protein FWF47_00875 [Clostridia bacterium]|nr:hypothetical protein [Clostridia bacterium]
MKKTRFLWRSGFTQLFSTRLFGILLVVGLSCSFIAIQLMYGMNQNSNAKSAWKAEFCSFTLEGGNLVPDMDIIKTAQLRIGSFGEVTFIACKDLPLTHDGVLSNGEAHGHDESREAHDESYMLFGYYGYYKPGSYFAESSGRFLSAEELEGDGKAAYLSTGEDEKTVQSILPDGFKTVGDGGCFASFMLSTLNFQGRFGSVGDISCMVAMKDFIQIIGSVSHLNIRLSPFNINDTDAVMGILRELFKEAVITPPVSIDTYFSRVTVMRLMLCAVICLVALINVLHLFLFIVRKAKDEIQVFAICGARRNDVYAFVAYIWTLASLLAFVLSQAVLVAFYSPLKSLELFIPPSFTLCVLGFMVTWLIPYLVCLPALRKNLNALYALSQGELT